MNPMKTKNPVAKILQIYAIVNAAAGLILAFYINSEYYWFYDALPLAVLFLGGVIVSSFAIYAVGEIIELLNQIKLNTSNHAIENALDDLPDL